MNLPSATVGTPALHRALALLAAGLLGASPAWAAPADVQHGAAIAAQGVPPAVAACVTCHGAKGEGGPGFPPLAGQGAGYLREQLDAFADGTRANAIMAPIAKGLDAPARADVAAWFASLPSGIAPQAAGPADPKDQGAWLVERGRWADGIPACASCHGPGGAGVGEHFPALARLGAAYMQAQIDAWKSGQRPPGPLGLMQGIAKKLSHDDISAVAQYYASRPPSAGQP
ncbi:MAG: c-type cytochrome [Burkholderiales bacterium]|nr:c-type cytochrome [Burkholderiales bacterium]MBS0401644.1 c-type cytochrome [Pseudomonadota bacterium]MBS0414696.1 c-type cytochrome [Pseudomonadota bacterium]